MHNNNFSNGCTDKEVESCFDQGIIYQLLYTSDINYPYRFFQFLDS